MDVEPIYCAEQIVVPVDLADVLKAYTKEVIRRQPADLVEFSAKYFTNLANVAASAEEAAVPGRDQLIAVYQRANGSETLSVQQLASLCHQCGIDKGVVAKVMEAGHFRTVVDVDKFLFLLLAMTCESFAGVVQGIFSLFGSELNTQRFITLIGHLAPDMDPEITTQFLSDLASSLLDVDTVTYHSVASLGVLQAKMAQ